MYAEMIKNMEPSRIDDDTISGLEIMLEQDSFKDLHSLIRSKLDEVKAKKKQSEKVVGSFKMKMDTYYKTLNGSIVLCMAISPDDEHEIYKMVVLTGGHNDEDLNNPISFTLFGDTRKYGVYVVDSMGRCCSAVGVKEYPMHIQTEVQASFSLVDKAK